MMIRDAGHHPLKIHIAQQCLRSDFKRREHLVPTAWRERIIPSIMPQIEDEAPYVRVLESELSRNILPGGAQYLIVIAQAQIRIDLSKLPTNPRPAAEFLTRESNLLP